MISIFEKRPKDVTRDRANPFSSTSRTGGGGGGGPGGPKYNTLPKSTNMRLGGGGGWGPRRCWNLSFTSKNCEVLSKAWFQSYKFK